MVFLVAAVLVLLFHLFHAWIVHVSIIAFSDEWSRSFMFWVFRGEVKTLYLETF